MGLARTDERYPSAFDQQKELTDLRAELPWLADVPRDACARVLADLDVAWRRCFDRVSRRPNWKCKGDPIGLCEPHPKSWSLKWFNVRFPKLGTLRTVQHRPLEGKPKTCVLKRDGDQWFASILCEIEVADPAPRPSPVVALDRGVVNVVADSDGKIVKSPQFYAAAMKRLARAQRAVSRKKKGSKNREKAKARVSRIHRKVRRQREHFIHGLSHDYAKSHGTVVVEKLQTKNMVRVGGGLARGILDAGWGQLVEKLKYKLAWSGGTLVEVAAAYSSQTCSACQHVDAASRTSQADFCCTKCGSVFHADLNAALVLRQRFEAPGNPWCQPVEGSSLDARRSRKRGVGASRVPKAQPLTGLS